MADGSSQRLVVIGASAGGITALLAIAESLPARCGAPVCIVQHVGTHPSLLPELIGRRSCIPAMHAGEGQELLPGAIYIAPPDRHLLVDGRRLRLSKGPRENHTRPAIDPLFRSAALHWGSAVIGVVLTGFLDDGTAGLAAIKQCGGTAIVEDPATAQEPSMPQSALDHVQVDHCVAVGEIAPLLVKLIGQPVHEAPRGAPEVIEREVAINGGHHVMDNLQAMAERSSLTCPDCGGGLWEAGREQADRLREHIGTLTGVLESMQETPEAPNP